MESKSGGDRYAYWAAVGVVGHVRIRSATPCETDGPTDYIFLISSKSVVPKRSNDVGSKKIPLQRGHHLIPWDRLEITIM